MHTYHNTLSPHIWLLCQLTWKQYREGGGRTGKGGEGREDEAGKMSKGGGEGKEEEGRKIRGGGKEEDGNNETIN